MTPGFEMVVDLGDVEEGLSAMERRAHALAPVIKTLVKPMRDDQSNHRKAKESPDGRWAPRASSTVLRAHGKRKLSRSILGRLTSAVSWKTTEASITGTSKVRWSGAHQDGARVGRGSRLPARTFLWLSDEFQNLAQGTIAGAMLTSFGGGAR